MKRTLAYRLTGNLASTPRSTFKLFAISQISGIESARRYSYLVRESSSSLQLRVHPFAVKKPITTIHSRRTMSSLPKPPSPETLQSLYKYTACDISDALLKLKVSGSGYLADLQPHCSAAESSPTGITIAPASTVLFAPKSGSLADYGLSNIPEGSHWVDLTTPETIVVLSQPAGQKNAVCGGIMALRMKICNAKGVVVGGRIRDIEELKSTGLPMWAMGVSTVGTGAETKPHALNVPIKISDVEVNPGDIMFCDPVNGVVVIPRERLEEVVELIPRLVAADDKVKEDVAKGMLVQEAFKVHRGNL